MMNGMFIELSELVNARFRYLDAVNDFKQRTGIDTCDSKYLQLHDTDLEPMDIGDVEITFENANVVHQLVNINGMDVVCVAYKRSQS